MSQSSYFKSRPDPVTLVGFGGETRNLEKLLEWRGRDETWWEEQAPSLVLGSDLVTSAI